MASTKRSLSDFHNKEEFPFSIVNNRIEFPKLFSKTNKSKNIRFWFIYAILKQNTNDLEINIDLFDIENFKEFNTVNKNLSIHIYTEYGVVDGKLTQTTPTILEIGKNLDKKNETTIITQALIQMRSLYLKKMKTGYMLDLDEIKDIGISLNDNIYPMALHDFKKFGRHIEYPCYIQPKLDGIRITGSYNKETDKVTLLSRRLHDIYGFENIKDEIKILLKNNPDLIVDGEFYNHNLNLQKISGIVRQQDINHEDKLNLQFYIFDCIDLKNELTFQERIEKLYELFNESPNLKYLVLTETILVGNEEEANDLYNRFISEKYEGIVYKNATAKYEYSEIKEVRSYNFLKRKLHHDGEYEIVGYESGEKGKDKGAIIFIMKTSDGKEFKSVPNMSLEKRKEMFILAEENFDSLYKGKLATISFDDYSEDLVPLRAKFITIRDYE
jgi:ATP-dependent DNA ligase